MKNEMPVDYLSSINLHLSKIVMPIFYQSNSELFTFTKEYKEQFNEYLKNNTKNESDILQLLQPIVTNYYGGRKIDSIILIKNNLTTITLGDEEIKKLNYHFSFQGFMETIRQFEMIFNLNEDSNGYIEKFAQRTIENYKCLCKEKIKNLLDGAIKKVVIPSGANKMEEILQFLNGKGVEQLKEIYKSFDEELKKVKKLIELEYKELKILYELNKEQGINFNAEIFKKAETQFSDQITKCFDELKADLTSAIKEKTLFIEQVKNEYTQALKGFFNDQQPHTYIHFENLYYAYCSNYSEDKDKQIYNKLPKWIQQGIDGYTTKLIIGDEEVGFILNKSQKAIIDALKIFADLNNPTRSQIQTFYVGTGGGKSYLNNLISGLGGFEIKGSDGNSYSSINIKKAIFGDSEPNIISINFHQIKNLADLEKLLSASYDKTKKNILILDEYHLFPLEVRNNLKNILANYNIFIIKSTATPTPEELYYKNLKIEILGDSGTKKLSKDTHNEILSKIDLFLGYEQNKNILTPAKKYELIIDGKLTLSDYKEKIQKNKFNLLSKKNPTNLVVNKNPDIKIFCFKNDKNQEQFFIEELRNGSYCNVDSAVINGVAIKNFSKAELIKYLSKVVNKTIQIYYTDSTSAGGDVPIYDHSGNTQITIVISEQLLNRPPTQLVSDIIQALGRYRGFDFGNKDSFKDVRFINKNGDDIFNDIKRKFEQAKNFYSDAKSSDIENIKFDLCCVINNMNLEEKTSPETKDTKLLLDYLENKFKNDVDKNYIALFYKIIQDNKEKGADELIKSLKLTFNDSKEFKEFESFFVVAYIINQLQDSKHAFVTNITVQDSKHAFVTNITDKAGKIIDSHTVLQDKIESFKEALIKGGILLAKNVSLSSELVFIVNNKGEIIVDYIIKVTSLEQNGATFATCDTEGQTKTIAFKKACVDKNDESKFSYNKTLEYLEEENNVIEQREGIKIGKILTYMNHIKSKEYNPSPGVFILQSENNCKEGNDAISLEAKAILHLFNKVLGGENGFTQDDKKLINEFFEKNVAQGGGGDSTKTLENDAKLAIIKKALSQRNKYDKSGNKNEGKNRAGNSYKALKTTLQTLNDNINFTTESLKLFNVDNKETLKNDKEKESLINEKALFMRAMGSAKISNFKTIDTTNVPDKNILLLTGTKPSKLQTRLFYLKEKRHNDSNQK